MSGNVGDASGWGPYFANPLRKIPPPQFHNFYQYTSSSIVTYNVREKKVILPLPRTTNYGLKSIKYIGTKLWNNIPQPICTSKSFNIFNNKTKKYLLGIYEY